MIKLFKFFLAKRRLNKRCKQLRRAMIQISHAAIRTGEQIVRFKQAYEDAIKVKH